MIKNLKLSYRIETLDAGLDNIDKAKDKQELNNILKQNEKNSQYLLNSIKSDLTYINSIEENPKFKNNLYILLYKNEYVNLFIEKKYQEAFNFAFSLFSSSKNIKEKSYFIYATALSLVKIKEHYLTNNLWVEYNSRFYQIEEQIKNKLKEEFLNNNAIKENEQLYVAKALSEVICLNLLENKKSLSLLINKNSENYEDYLKLICDYIYDLPFWVKSHTNESISYKIKEMINQI